MKEALHFATACRENIRDILDTLQYVSPIPDLNDLINNLQVLEAKVAVLPQMLADSRANPSSTEAIVRKLLYYLFQTEQLSQKWLTHWEEDDQEDISILLAKFVTFNEMIDTAITLPADDLIFLPRTHPRWERLARCMKYRVLGEVNDILEATEEFLKNIAVSNAFMSKGFEESNSYFRKLTLGASMMYYGLSKERAMRRTKYFYSKPNIDAAFAVWNLTDSQLGAPFYSVVCPSIVVSKVVFLPRLQTDDHSTQHFALQWDKRPTHVPIRVICGEPMPRLEEFDPSDCCKPPKPVQFYELIIHIHGGGFVSMSSSSHQSYTRQWAKKLQAPIISIDYRLAPRHKYPAAVDDVWDAYIWLIQHAESELGIRPNRVVLVGDSAGGNLALAITNRAIECGHRAPDGLLLAYPAVTLDCHAFSHSLMLSLEDMLLPHTFLKMCVDSYVRQTDDPSTDYYLSPLVTPHANLLRFPRTRLISGTKDPLHDDCLRFLERLVLAGVDAKATEYEGLLHGFLSYDMKLMGIGICSQAVADAGDMLAELLTGAKLI
jgi:hormone-sensitive lipase